MDTPGFAAARRAHGAPALLDLSTAAFEGAALPLLRDRFDGPDQVSLVLGLLGEAKAGGGAAVGELCGRIVVRQLARARAGDVRWFEGALPAVTVARLLETNVVGFLRKALGAPSETLGFSVEG